ncbi:cytochrome c family protein [bacterium]|nr:cytochrome c family protein [bacterium]MBU1993693.1 cytochrome c family protein [bacterium]
MKTEHIKIYILLLFITGILQMDILKIDWEYFRYIQALHILGSVVITVFLLVPLVNRHVYKHIIVQKERSVNGLVLGAALLFITLSGFYLFLFGNRGGDIYGTFSFNIHLYGSFFLIIALLKHAKKRINPTIVSSIAVIFIISIIYPTLSWSDENNKLTNMQLEKNVEKYHVQDWTNSAKCKSCHNEIFNQWADSNHRHIAGTNPYYMVMENLAGEDKGQEFRKWCMGCHNPSAVTTGQEKTTHAMSGNNMPDILFSGGSADLIDALKTHGNARLEQGVSCITCHRIMKTESKGNSSYTLDLTNRNKYVFEDSDSGMKHWLSEKFINSNPQAHKESYSNPIYKKSAYCASCHDEFLPESGLGVVSTFKEWEKSPFNNPADSKKHKDCIDCHMTNLKDNKFSPLKGTSTEGGKLKDDVKVHYFAGSNHFLSGLKNKVNADQTIQLLKTSAELDVDIQEGIIKVGVKNIGAGHHLPTGVSDFRELWLDITIKDKNNKVVFESGKLQKDNNLGEDARPFMKVFGDENSVPVGLLFWRYKKLLSDTRIPAGEKRVETYAIQDSKKLQYPLTATVKLNFRIYPQWVTDAVRNAFPQLPNPPVVELNKIVKEFTKQ